MIASVKWRSLFSILPLTRWAAPSPKHQDIFCVRTHLLILAIVGLRLEQWQQD
ncbi:hypothetical protein [Nostoc sp. WHI]|uniref:hypothetical protein n=1 Tax=Nostoc sp. WHI TaxID=2650611 RepID=UPI001E4D72E9|nr:hypothetical protein [Nostoc sp. WHI]